MEQKLINLVDHLIDQTKTYNPTFKDDFIDYFLQVRKGLVQGKDIKEINQEING